MKQAALVPKPVGERRFEGAVDGLLGGHQRYLPQAVDFLGHAQGLFHQLVGRHHAGDQPPGIGLGGVDPAVGEHHVHGLGLADGARQALGAASAGHHADGDLGLAELGVVRGDDHVAHHRHLAAAAQGHASHRSDHRLAHTAHGLPVAADVFAAVGVAEVVVLHRRDVRAGSEGFLAAGEHDATDAGVGVESQQRLAEFVHQLVIQSVHLLGPVQTDQAGLQGAIADLFGQDAFVGHGALLSVVNGLYGPGRWPAATRPAAAVGPGSVRHSSRRPCGW